MMPFALLQAKHSRFVQGVKPLVPPALWQFLYRNLVIKDIPDSTRYGMVYQPWMEPDRLSRYARIADRTLVRPEGLYHLESRLAQALNTEGVVYELGTYKGGTARLLRELLDGKGRTLRLFDTFSGMQKTNLGKGDRHRVGDFSDTSLESVRAYVGKDSWIDYRQGWVPDTFSGLEADRIAFAHIDLDLHDPIFEATSFIYPRLSPGGTIVFDDYGFPSTPGARRAIDSFFEARPEKPLILQTGQAIVFKN